MKNDHEPLFTNHVTLLLGLILPDHFWSKKIAMYYGVMKEKLNTDYLMQERSGCCILTFNLAKHAIPK